MTEVTRRAMLTGLATAPVAMALPAVAVGAAPAVASIEKWELAYNRAVEAERAYEEAGYADEIASDRFMLACKAIQPEGLIDSRHAPIFAQLHSIDLDDIAGLYEPPHTGEFGNGAAMMAEIAEYRRRRDELHVESGLTAAEEAMRPAIDEVRDAFAALLAMPAPTIAALADKLAIAAKNHLREGDVQMLHDDARRLAEGH